MKDTLEQNQLIELTCIFNGTTKYTTRHSNKGEHTAELSNMI